jgi:hypothetical protein
MDEHATTLTLMHTRPMPLVCTAGSRGLWYLTVEVDGKRQILSGKSVKVVAYDYTETLPDGATASGPLTQGQP